MKRERQISSPTVSDTNSSTRGKLLLLLGILMGLGAVAVWLNADTLRRYQLERMETAALIASVRQNPQDVLAAQVAGRRCLDRDSIAEANTFLPAAAQANPSDVALQVLAGRLAWKNGEPQRAGTSFNAALQIAPYDVEALRWTGELLLSRGRKTEAESLWRDAVRLDPSRGDIWRRMAEVHIDAQEFAPALNALDEAEKVTPSGVVARLRASVLLSLRRQNEAEASARLALQREPNAVSYRLLGEIVQTNASDERLREAQTYLKKARQLEPNNGATLELLALNHRSLGEHRQAVQILRALIGQTPAHTQSYLLMSQSYRSMGDLRRAEATLRVFRHLQPLQEKADRARAQLMASRGTIAAQLAYVRALLELGRIDLARPVLERAWSKAPNNPQIQKLAQQCQQPPPPVPALPPDSNA